MGKIFCFLIGIFFLLLGFIGLLIPVVPQVPFLVTGVTCLCISSPKFKRRFKDSRLYQDYLKRFLDSNEKLKTITDKFDL